MRCVCVCVRACGSVRRTSKVQAESLLSGASMLGLTETTRYGWGGREQGEKRHLIGQPSM